MNFQVESENLRAQAEIWEESKVAADKVRANLAETIGRGDMFGYMAGSAGVTGMYDDWTRAINDCLADASYSFAYLDAALRSTAAGYDNSDATTAMSMDELDKLLDEENYNHD
jgi:hypothetical protein